MKMAFKTVEISSMIVFKPNVYAFLFLDSTSKTYTVLILQLFVQFCISILLGDYQEKVYTYKCLNLLLQ